MIQEILLNLDIQHRILIILYFIMYLAAMLIQIQDPNARVRFMDWILALLTSAVGGMVTYFVVMQWANVGLRMGATLFASLVSYRTIKFIVSDETQNDFTKSFWAGMKSFINRIFNIQQNNNNNNDTDGRS